MRPSLPPSQASHNMSCCEQPATHNRNLVGAKGFKRQNPLTDLFPIHRFHHVEFWCGDATSTSRRRDAAATPVPQLRWLSLQQRQKRQCNVHRMPTGRLRRTRPALPARLPPHTHTHHHAQRRLCRFGYGLGMTHVAHSDQSTGNQHYSSHVMRSGELVLAFTAPYGMATDKAASAPPAPGYDQGRAFDFLKKHGLAVRAVGEEGGGGALDPGPGAGAAALPAEGWCRSWPGVWHASAVRSREGCGGALARETSAAQAPWMCHIAHAHLPWACARRLAGR